MMISPSIGRGIALALPVALSWGAWTVFVAPPLEQIASDRDRIAQARRSLRRYDRLERDIPVMKRRLADLREGSSDTDYIPLASPALMSAVLQDKVQGLASTTAAVIRSNRTLPSVTEHGFERVTVELALTADPSDLRMLLQAFSRAKPDILVERLAIQMPEVEQLSDSDIRPTFEVVLTLSCLAKLEFAKSTPSP